MSTPSELSPSVANLSTISAKIRTLAEQGKARADIARLLGIRYQHVRNVLEHDKVRNLEAKGKGLVTSGVLSDQTGVLTSVKLRLGPDGRIVVPAVFREAIGLKEGDVLFALLEDSEIHLLTPKAAMLRAQAVVRQFVPEGVSLVDELIEDRRREVEREVERG
jgi:AbrB family looped-hinge helix DNA binding protein